MDLAGTREDDTRLPFEEATMDQARDDASALGHLTSSQAELSGRIHVAGNATKEEGPR